MGEKIEVLALSRDTGLALDEAELVLGLTALYDDQFVALGRLERAPGDNDNWVEAVGKLPRYIEDIANSLHTKRGMTISRAIATAISRIKRWAAGGDNVKADTRAKAAKALAEWEALRAKAHAKRLAK